MLCVCAVRYSSAARLLEEIPLELQEVHRTDPVAAEPAPSKPEASSSHIWDGWIDAAEADAEGEKPFASGDEDDLDMDAMLAALSLDGEAAGPGAGLAWPADDDNDAAGDGTDVSPPGSGSLGQRRRDGIGGGCQPHYSQTGKHCCCDCADLQARIIFEQCSFKLAVKFGNPFSIIITGNILSISPDTICFKKTGSIHCCLLGLP